MKNLLFKSFGTFLNTQNMEQYKINNVIIFKENQKKIISNYFLDNMRKQDYQFEINGDIKRKLKIDLSLSYNFVIKSEEQDPWDNVTKYDLYINGDLNNYNFIKLSLIGERLEILYTLNGFECSHCIGWNNKKSQNIKYHTFPELVKKLDSFRLEHHTQEITQDIKELEKIVKEYKKAIDLENTYTEKDYKKMSLSSGTTEEQNKEMLKNNGFEI